MDLLRSLPLGLYLEEPVTWLHRLDSRVKLAWLMSLLAAPVLATSTWRILLVVFLVLLTLSARIPSRVWRQQMGWLLILSGLILVLTAVTPDGLAIESQSRLPKDELSFLQAPPPSLQTNTPESPALEPSTPSLPPVAPSTPTPIYRYVLFQQGPFTITRRSLDLAIRVSTLLFTLIYSTNLYLLTTAPEEITAGLEDLMQPLRWLRLPVTEITLTLTLALRFIPLVLEEIQNMVRSVRTRAINWKKLGMRRMINLWMTLVERILANLLLRAEQIASAMQVRGFTSPDQHRVPWHDTDLRSFDWIGLAGLMVFWGLRLGRPHLW